jgi:FlaA1/EpsC-like NDP-sugar epimerase
VKRSLVWRRRRLLVLLLDLVLFAGAYAGAYLIRMDLSPYPSAWIDFSRTLPTLLATKSVAFTLAGTYRRIVTYATLPDLLAIVRNGTLSSLAVLVAFNTLAGHRPFSRGVLIIDWMLTVGLLAASRIGWRLVREGFVSFERAPGRALKRVLIVGAGRAGMALAKDLMTNRRQDLDVVGFVDDDPDKQDATLLGRPILGTTKDLPEIRRRRPIDRVIVAIPSASPRVLRRIAELARGVRDFRVVPPIDALLRGSAIVPSVPVPEESLLSRDTVDLAAASVTRFFVDKTVLVTGAAGSIGSELARQLAHRDDGRVRKLVLLDCAETPLYDIHRQSVAALGRRAVAVLASVRDLDRMAEVLAAEKPDVVLHAAALKHVPMCEAHPLEAIATNAWATCRLAELAREQGVASFTLVSTDKAVAPSCVMGASKRAAETYVQSLALASATRFAAVRFGNVLGSNGSVLPLFHEQIAAGGPVTVTDPRATRFFMTIPEACGLILQATAIAQGGEVYLLDMGEPVRVLDIAHNLIRLYGYEPGKDIEVKTIGLRPGEKLHESLVDEAEEAEPLRHAKLLRVRGPSPDPARCRGLVGALEQALRRRDEDDVIRTLCALVPTYRRTPPREDAALPLPAVGLPVQVSP